MRQDHRETVSANPIEPHMGISPTWSAGARGWALASVAESRHEAQRPLEVLRLSMRTSGWRGMLIIAPTARTMFTTAALRAARIPRS